MRDLPTDTLSRIARGCVMHHVRAAARRVTHVYEAALKPHDLTASQFSLMVAIARAGDRGIAALAEGLDFDRTTVTRLLGPLERRGLVRRGADKTDARARPLTLTDDGAALLARALPDWEHAQSRVAPADWDLIRTRIETLGR